MKIRAALGDAALGFEDAPEVPSRLTDQLHPLSEHDNQPQGLRAQPRLTKDVHHPLPIHGIASLYLVVVMYRF